MSLLSGKKVLVTSGGTREYLDDVRVITNISTGALGAKIAEALYHNGAKVHYVHGVTAHMPNLDEGFSDGTLTTYPIKTCNDLLETMKAIIPAFNMDAVIHSAAVSDFTFKRDKAIKVGSDSEEDFVDYIRRTIVRTPKIIQQVKVWRPETVLIGFKFTVGKSSNELIHIAKESGMKSDCDAVFANDKSMMVDRKDHVGYFVSLKPSYTHEVKGKDNIANYMVDYLADKFLLVPKG